MRIAPWLLVPPAVLIVGSIAGIAGRRTPLGVPGEWEWLRVRFAPTDLDALVGGAVVLAYAGLVALGHRLLRDQPGRARRAVLVLLLAVAAAGAQLGMMAAAPSGYGLAKWAGVLSDRGATGYHEIAAEIDDFGAFLRQYPEWLRSQDALHIGTHPPGLILTAWHSLALTRSHPEWSRWVARAAPATFVTAAPAEMAAYVLTGLFVLMMSSAAVIPIYLMARATTTPAAAWAAASLWPLAPAAILFQPTADTAYPLLAAIALAFAASAGRGRAGAALMAAAMGAVLGVGMLFSLVFLAVGLVGGLVLLGKPGATARTRLLAWSAAGFGFLATAALLSISLGVNLFASWWVNQGNHARFYAEYPRTYLAWVLINPIETAIAVGLPAACWAAIGLRRHRSAVSWATLLTMILLTLSGRSLSEVARLWLPLFPGLFAAVAVTAERANTFVVAVAVLMTGAVTWKLQGLIQVVYPA